jgi:hypothetical protein
MIYVSSVRTAIRKQPKLLKTSAARAKHPRRLLI